MSISSQETFYDDSNSPSSSSTPQSFSTTHGTTFGGSHVTSGARASQVQGDTIHPMSGRGYGYPQYYPTQQREEYGGYPNDEASTSTQPSTQRSQGQEESNNNTRLQLPWNQDYLGFQRTGINVEQQPQWNQSPLQHSGLVYDSTRDYDAAAYMKGEEQGQRVLLPRSYINMCTGGGKGSWEGLLATHDTGSQQNWIDRGIVDRLQLRVKQGLAQEFITFNGENLISYSVVQATWDVPGSSKSYKCEFRVVDNAPFDVLFGFNFLNSESGRIFDSKRNQADPIQVLVQKKKSSTEQEIIDRNRKIAAEESAVLRQVLSFGTRSNADKKHNKKYRGDNKKGHHSGSSYKKAPISGKTKDLPPLEIENRHINKLQSKSVECDERGGSNETFSTYFPTPVQLEPQKPGSHPRSTHDSSSTSTSTTTTSTLHNAQNSYPNYKLAELKAVVLANLWSEELVSSDASTIQGQRTKKWITFTMDWNPLSFVTKYLDENSVSSLGSVLTLSGSALSGYATTCAGYIKQHWPITAEIVLCTIEEAISKQKSRNRLDDFEIILEIEKKTIVYLSGRDETIVEVVQQLAWIGAALRVSSYYGLEYCETIMRKSEDEVIELVFKTMQIPENETSCWHKLFCNAVIAQGFPVPERQNQVGLEIPIAMMAALGGATRIVEFEGGPLIKGFSTAFIPINVESGLLQWHCELNIDGSRLTYRDIIAKYPQRILSSQIKIEDLAMMRNFLGWCAVAEPQFGAEAINYGEINWSGAREPSRSVKLSTASFGISHLLTGALNFNFSHRDKRLLIKRENDLPLRRIIQCASRIPVVLYDTSDKRGWLTTAADTIMHAAVTKISKLSHIANEKCVLLKYANPSLHRFEAAQKSLEENLVLKLIDRVEGDAIGDRNYLFKDLVLELWQAIEYIAEMNVEQDCVPGETVRATMRERIRGWEFMDLVQDTQVLQPKEVMIDKTSGGWADLAGESEVLVLFASGFGDLIKPASMASGLCPTWKTVPTNKDYLASGVPILQMLLERTGPNKDQGYITNSGLKWDYTPTTCQGPQGSLHTCVHLQRLFHDSTTIGRTKSPRQLSEEGAVIFGKDGLNSHAKSSIYSQPNLPWELEKKPTFLHVDTSKHESENPGRTTGDNDAYLSSSDVQGSSSSTSSLEGMKNYTQSQTNINSTAECKFICNERLSENTILSDRGRREEDATGPEGAHRTLKLECDNLRDTEQTEIIERRSKPLYSYRNGKDKVDDRNHYKNNYFQRSGQEPDIHSPQKTRPEAVSSPTISKNTSSITTYHSTKPKEERHIESANTAGSSRMA